MSFYPLEQIKRRMRARARLGERYPVNLYFEITDRCTLRCAYCAIDQVIKQGVKSVGDIDFDLVKKIVDEFSAIARVEKGVMICPGGGEPLLYPRFMEVVRLIRHKIPEALITLFTNGTVLDENLSEKLIDSGLDSVVLSINLWGKDVYKKLHGSDKFEQVVRNMKRFLLMKGSRSPRAILQILDIDANEGRIEPFKSFWQPFMNENDRIDVSALHDFGGFVSVNQFINKPPARQKRYPCNDLFTTVMIDKEGFIYPCCFGGLYGQNTDLCLGNIKKVSLREVYDKGEKIQMLRTLHKKKKYSSVYPCNACNSWRRFPTPFFDIGFSWV